VVLFSWCNSKRIIGISQMKGQRVPAYGFTLSPSALLR